MSTFRDPVATGAGANGGTQSAITTIPSYIETSEGLVWLKVNGDSPQRVLLANFRARIVADTRWDDGSGEVRRTFTLEAKLAGRTRTLDVPAGAFAGMSWVPDLGAGAYLEPGQSARERARHAIQVLSNGHFTERCVFGHTGWREVDGRCVWLHADGGISAYGQVDGVEVSLPSQLAPLRMPSPPQGEQLRTAILASLELLELGSEELAVAIGGATYRAPLGDADLTVHVFGATGAYKSQRVALCQQHFGAAFDALKLPASWSSTANALEELAFNAKDALVVIDDFAPHGSSQEIARMHAKADRLVRAQGNCSGRGRMRTDGTLRPVRPPRGLIISTGEEIPRGHSLRSRMVSVEQRRCEVDLGTLTHAQREAAEGVYARAMSAFLAWLASFDRLELKALVARREHDLRSDLANSGHPRNPANIAKLATGWEAFLAFAAVTGAIADPRPLWRRVCAALLRLEGAQAEHEADAEPSARFLQLLSGALASGRAHLEAPEGGSPPDAAAWGWRSRDGDDWAPAPGSERIGWADDECVYLNPTASYRAAQRAGDDAGEALAASERTLWKRMRERELLVCSDEKGRSTVRRTLGDRRNRRVLHLATQTLLAPDDSLTPPGAGASGAAVTRPPETVELPAYAGVFERLLAAGGTGESGAAPARNGHVTDRNSSDARGRDGQNPNGYGPSRNRVTDAPDDPAKGNTYGQ
jgi:hypothetical protein